MKHHFVWGEMGMGHCRCCPCGEGVYPLSISAGKPTVDQYMKDRERDSVHCYYEEIVKQCQSFTDEGLFLKILEGYYIAWTIEDYPRLRDVPK